MYQQTAQLWCQQQTGEAPGEIWTVEEGESEWVVNAKVLCLKGLVSIIPCIWRGRTSGQTDGRKDRAKYSYIPLQLSLTGDKNPLQMAVPPNVRDSLMTFYRISYVTDACLSSSFTWTWNLVKNIGTNASFSHMIIDLSELLDCLSYWYRNNVLFLT